MSALLLENISRTYRPSSGGEHRALSALTLAVDHGEALALVGPSGCGKTTTLRLIAGLEKPEQGKIFFNGVDVSSLSPQQRDVAMVFQEPALLPHLDAFDNIALGLKLRGTARKEIQTRVSEIAELLGLADKLRRRPAELSGGEAQRVALGRALVRRPRVLLLDEPLSHVDAGLRGSLRREIVRVQRHFKLPMIYVTHDLLEAMAVADRMAVLHAGVLQQVDVPEKIRQQPANALVAQLIEDLSPGLR
jgi:ABC-type sugar transport system ATPase subunit